jgi:hypothetical protein
VTFDFLVTNRVVDAIDAADVCGDGEWERVAPMEFTVGLKRNAKVEHYVVDAEDALIAALKAKIERPDATIMYVRPKNRRGDARHPSLLSRK